MLINHAKLRIIWEVAYESFTEIHENLIWMSFIDNFGISVAMLCGVVNSGQAFMKCRGVIFDIENTTTSENYKGLTMKLKVKYLFPASYSGPEDVIKMQKNPQTRAQLFWIFTDFHRVTRVQSPTYIRARRFSNGYANLEIEYSQWRGGYRSSHETLTQVFSCEFGEFFKNTFFKHSWDCSALHVFLKIVFSSRKNLLGTSTKEMSVSFQKTGDKCFLSSLYYTQESLVLKYLTLISIQSRKTDFMC